MSANPIDEAVVQLRRLADVIRKHGTVPSLSLEHIANTLTAAQQQGRAVAWMRRNVRYKEADGRSEGERIVSERQVYPDDIPLYAAPPPSVPQGWVLVPVEPTDEMVEAAWDSDAADYVGEHKRIHSLGLAWSAMIAAAPQPAQQQGQAVAWLAADGSGRVIDHKAKAAGGRALATGSATSIYSIPLYTAPPSAPVCTCPSGDGSLRWPCPVHPPSAPVGDDPIDASDNAEYIEHCADRLERLGLRATAGALRVIAHEHRTLAQQPAAVDGARPLDEWHEDDGPVVWWKLPVDESAWIGTPLDSDWPGYHTHWTPHPAVPALATQHQEPKP